MIYALNVFNLLPGKEDQYRDYRVKAGKIIYSLGGKVVSSGWKPIRRLHEDQTGEYFIVVEFPSEEVFQQFIDDADKQDFHELRRQPALIIFGPCMSLGIYVPGCKMKDRAKRVTLEPSPRRIFTVPNKLLEMINDPY